MPQPYYGTGAGQIYLCRPPFSKTMRIPAGSRGYFRRVFLFYRKGTERIAGLFSLCRGLPVKIKRKSVYNKAGSLRRLRRTPSFQKKNRKRLQQSRHGGRGARHTIGCNASWSEVRMPAQPQFETYSYTARGPAAVRAVHRRVPPRRLGRQRRARRLPRRAARGGRNAPPARCATAANSSFRRWRPLRTAPSSPPNGG